MSFEGIREIHTKRPPLVCFQDNYMLFFGKPVPFAAERDCLLTLESFSYTSV
jgi:hypothetical protein